MSIYRGSGTPGTGSLLEVSHSGLADLQGGQTGQYYHLTAAEHTLLTGYVSGGIDHNTDTSGHQGGSASERYHLSLAEYNQVQTNDHNTTTSKQGGTAGEYYHLTAAQHTSLTGWVASGINHNTDLVGWQGGTTNEYYHLTNTQHTDVVALIGDTRHDSGIVSFGTTVANPTGPNNTLIGYKAGFTGAGATRTLVGNLAGEFASGPDNTGFGDQALRYATGTGNAGFGRVAGDGVTSGSYNTLLGQNADVTVGTISYGTAVGSGALVTTSNTVVLGRTTDNTVIGAASDDGSGRKLQVTGTIGQSGNTVLDTGDLGSSVQAYSARLADVAGLTPTDGNIIVGDGANFVAESGATARTSLGLTIGTDVQAYSATLGTMTRQVFTGSGTYTKPTGLAYVIVEVIGGGGSGSRLSTSAGGGGGAGGYASKFIAAGSIGATETVTVGAGGALVAIDSAGNNGGTSSFGAHCSATGGTGGYAGGIGGDSGVGSGGDLNTGLGLGGHSTTRASGSLAAGQGGGAGGVANGGSAVGIGGGGAGGTTGNSGAGGAGIVIVTEFYV